MLNPLHACRSDIQFITNYSSDVCFLDSILNLYKSIARQYAYLYQLFKVALYFVLHVLSIID